MTRIVQWATGNIGARALRGVIEHPGLELAGVYVTAPAIFGAHHDRGYFTVIYAANYTQ